MVGVRLRSAWLSRVRFGFMVFAVVALAAGEASTQTPQRSRPQGAASVTIVTDALGRKDSRAAQMIVEVARRLSEANGIRVLGLSSVGGATNIRDLLDMRGVDFAIVNSDVFAGMTGTRVYWRARRNVRYVMKLYDQRVLFLTRNGMSDLKSLQDRSIGILTESPATKLTLRTILGGAGVTANPMQIGDELPDVIFAMESEVGHLNKLAAKLEGYKPADIPLTDDLAKTYADASIAPSEVWGIRINERVQTLSVDTLLSVFNWQAASARRNNADAFIQALYANLPELRERSENSIWHHAAITAAVRGWSRYPRANPTRFLTPQQISKLASVKRIPFATEPVAPPVPPPSDRPETRPPTVSTEPAAVTSASGAIALSGQRGEVTIASVDESTPEEPVSEPPPTLRVLAFERPPMTRQAHSDGGLAGTLLRRAIEEANLPIAPELKFTWIKYDRVQISKLIEEGEFDLILPWDITPCDKPDALGPVGALLCDRGQFSQALMTVVVGLFAPTVSGITLSNPASLRGKRVCVAAGGASRLGGSAFTSWRRRHDVEIVRKPSLLACLAAVQLDGADAIAANELEGRFALQQLGLTQLFEMSQQPLAISQIAAVIPAKTERANELGLVLDAGITALRQTPAFDQPIREQLELLLPPTRTSAGPTSQ